ncbi:MAG: SPASM domain-containing protein [Veillonella atypica]
MHGEAICVAVGLSHEYYGCQSEMDDPSTHASREFCRQRIGYVLGNVYEGLKNTEIPKDFRNTHVFTKPTCAECWAKFFCSGGCHANNITLGGDLQTPYEFGCRLQKKRIECAIMIQAELEQAGIDGSIPVAIG